MYMREKDYADHVLPRIFISGCTSSCGTNQIGELGFQGTVKVIDKKAYPAFTLSIHGNDAYHKERFGENQGVILEEDMCRFLEAIGNAVSSHQMTYPQWLHAYKEEFDDILRTYVK